MPFRAAGIITVIALLALLGAGIHRAGVAETFSDPVSHIRAQDESVYANGALTMATEGGWLTPKFMGRYMLFKPPLLVWISALSLKLWERSVLALRLPILLIGAAATWLLIWWSYQAHSLWSAAAAGLLLIANPLWHTFSRLCYTDMLVTAAVVWAMFTLWRDMELATWGSAGQFGLAVAAGIMSKSVAGILPIPVLALFCLLARRRIPAGLWKALGIALLLIAPWHIYQMFVHGHWFWTEYVQVQLLGFGLHPPSPAEPAVPFYLKRLVWTDPVLCLFVILALPFLLRAVREHEREALLLLSWLVVVAISLAAFQFRNIPYLVQLIPPLCLIATAYIPSFSAKFGKVTVVALAAVFCVKLVSGAPVWGISYGVSTPLPSAAALHWYSSLSRSNQLIAVNTDDQFSASVMPIRTVHYVFIDPTGAALAVAPHYRFLGLALTAAEFQQLKTLEPLYRRRLEDWGLDSTEPLATAVFANSAEEVAAMVLTHPDSDFYLPETLRGVVLRKPEAAHRLVPLATSRFFLLAIDSSPSQSKKASLE